MASVWVLIFVLASANDNYATSGAVYFNSEAACGAALAFMRKTVGADAACVEDLAFAGEEL